MMRTNRLWRHLLAVSLATLGLSNATAKPRIVPLRTSATFSAQSPENRWSVPIKSPDGSTAYVLSLEPMISRTGRKSRHSAKSEQCPSRTWGW